MCFGIYFIDCGAELFWNNPACCFGGYLKTPYVENNAKFVSQMISKGNVLDKAHLVAGRGSIIPGKLSYIQQVRRVKMAK
ncbi:MAG: hypothetical protein HYR87_07395 [Thaumarchaeota archaeon]|nr:hypothetical protein [Nitrososphaerota archaeon]